MENVPVHPETGATSDPAVPSKLEGSVGSPANLQETHKPKSEKYRQKTADTLERAAAKVRAWGADAPGGDRTTQWGHQAGESMDRASTYLRSRPVDEISRDAQAWVKQNPAPLLILAAAVGFLAGAALRRR